MDSEAKQENQIERDEKGRFLPGHEGGPGRPKGSISIKDKIRQYLEEHPEDVEEIVHHFIKDNRELMWQMLEGRPQQDVTSGGESIQVPIYGGVSVQKHDSNQKDIQPQQEN